MKLEDHAKGGDAPEVVLAADQPHRPQAELLSDELVPADEITPEGEFPQYGRFLRVRAGGSEEYWECPQSLAAMVIEKAEEVETGVTGLLVDVDQVVKTPSGEWRYAGAIEVPTEGTDTG